MDQVDWEEVTNWTQPLIIKRLKEIQKMDWIKVSDYVTKFEDGQVGQSIERLFHVPENNLEEADLQPNHELKSIRLGGNLTLKHGFYSHSSLPRGALTSGIIQYKSQPGLHHALLEKYGHIHKKKNSEGVYITNPNRKILNDATTYNDFKSPVRKHEGNTQRPELTSEDLLQIPSPRFLQEALCSACCCFRCAFIERSLRKYVVITSGFDSI